MVFEALQESIGIDFFRGSHCAPVSTVLCAVHIRSSRSAAIPQPSCERGTMVPVLQRNRQRFREVISFPMVTQVENSGTCSNLCFPFSFCIETWAKIASRFSVLKWVCSSLWIFFTGMKSRPNKSVLHGNSGHTHTHTPETKGP